MDGSEHRAVVLYGLRRKGCTCDPNIIFEGDARSGKITSVRVQHDDWCPLLQRIESHHN